MIVADHRAGTGRDITCDQPRAQLRVSNATAGELLRHVRATTKAPAVVTGPALAPGRVD
jgi:hypothetical protein